MNVKYEIQTKHFRIRHLTESFKVFGITKYLLEHRAQHLSNFSIQNFEN